MSYITKDKAITVNGQTWWVNSTGSGLITHAIKSMVNQVDAMLSHHSKILIVRFDLHIYHQTKDNEIITIFNRRLFKWLKRNYNLKRIGFIWCREMETAKRQHYHYALMINGHKVRHPREILIKVKEIWEKHLNHSLEYTPKNCYYNLERDNYKSIQDAIYRFSYLAKARGKGYKPEQTKNYGTSRVKPNH
jgi:transcription initiation factor IIE alpha subunit